VVPCVIPDEIWTCFWLWRCAATRATAQRTAGAQHNPTSTRFLHYSVLLIPFFPTRHSFLPEYTSCLIVYIMNSSPSMIWSST